MNARELSALVATIVGLASTSWYIYLLVQRKKVKPVLATWIVLSVTIGLSLLTYVTAPRHNLVSNIGNSLGLLNCLSILVTILWVSRNDPHEVHFSPRQKKILAWASGIFLLWILIVLWRGLHGSGILPNILLQVLILVGYAFTAEKLWHARENTEPLFTWWCINVSSLFAAGTAYYSDDWLAFAFSLRGTLGCSVLLWRMHIAEARAKADRLIHAEKLRI